MRVLSLFSGGGLGDLGLTRAGMEIVGQVEWDKYCQQLLKLRWPHVPKWEDIRNVKGSEVVKTCGRIDIIAGGFPCPAFSAAGKRGGLEQDDLMYEYLRVIREINPEWVLTENVEGFKDWAEIFRTEIKSLGYEFIDFILDARDFGIPQARRRYFAVCVRRGMLPSPQHLRRVPGVESANLCGICSDSSHSQRRWTPTVSSKEEWRTLFSKHTRSGTSDGTPYRMDRFKILGNGIVVQCAEWLGRMIMEFNRRK